MDTLITLNIGLTLVGILGTMAGLVTMSIMLGRQLRELTTIQEGLWLQLRRQYTDIDRDLQEIKDLLAER